MSITTGAIWTGIMTFQRDRVPEDLGLPARHDAQQALGEPMYQSGWEPAVTLDGS